MATYTKRPLQKLKFFYLPEMSSPLLAAV